MIRASRTPISDILHGTPSEGELTVWGWVRTGRSSKNVAFVHLNDGSCFENLQLVIDREVITTDLGEALKTGACLKVTGGATESPGAGQARELAVSGIEVVGPADDAYPLQKKRHTLDFLRTMPHIRTRANTFMATFRVRSLLAWSVHRFFQERGFLYVHTPFLTGSDCEGAGEIFRVTTLDLSEVPRKDGKVDCNADFFGQPAFLTVSGQLEAEAFALTHGEVYTFGPTFRADPSTTPRHAAEFWMIEPEIAFADIDDNLALIEDFVKEMVRTVLEEAAPEMDFFDKRVERGLKERLAKVREQPFTRITFAEAHELLMKVKDRFEHEPSMDHDLFLEHERYLVDEVYERPLFITDYPKAWKPFYMRVNDDGQTVRGVDLLCPGVGEIVGGSQREERLDVLAARMKETGVDTTEYEWYLQTRRWGSAPHAGFGVGFERLIMFLTGMKNIRDVIPFPRSQGQLG
jgi:asparaginyl-tRNA synthetase